MVSMDVKARFAADVQLANEVVAEAGSMSVKPTDVASPKIEQCWLSYFQSSDNGDDHVGSLVHHQLTN